MRAIKILVALAFVITTMTVCCAVFADEGMYPLDSTESWPLEKMKKDGLKMEPADLMDLRKAVAKVAAGGSGSFVSSDGLLVTNHHVAYRCLAALDGTAEHKGVMKRGHVAATRGQEIPCPGYDLMVVDDVRDITDKVRGSVSVKLKGHKRFEAIRLAMEDLESECLQAGEDFYCDAAPLDGGLRYHMMVYKLIKDVRLVYAPQAALGKFGGDVDNWRYPRHTADFTFLRAYVGEDGKGAAFSGSNVPFKPSAHLDVSTQGVAKGDQVLVIGFPARTKRNFPAASARFASQVEMPSSKKIYDGLLEVLNKVSEKDDLAKRRYQGLDAGLNNASKYYTDVMNSFEQWKIVEKREQRDKTVDGKLVKKIDGIYKRFGSVYPKFFMLRRLAWIVKSVGTSFDIAMWTKERVKPDRERKEEAYKNKNMYKTVGNSDLLDEQITIGAEKALLGYIIREAQKLPGKAQIKAAKKLVRWGVKAQRELKKEARKAKKPYDEHYRELTGSDPVKDPVTTAIDLMYARTKLIAHGLDRDEMERALFQRRRLFYNDVKEARRFKDPLLDFARNVAVELERIKKGSYRAVEETFDTSLRPKYVEAVEAAYPDANFQVRLSHGKVDDYTASKDGKVHRYITDLQGVLDKDKGEAPFDVPEDLKKAAREDKGSFVDTNIDDVPVNFTCTLDTTGGNSGSGVLDASGRLVGILFDGTPESQLSDWQYLEKEQRSIVVDIRYALFLARKVHDAGVVLEEMKLGATGPTSADMAIED